MKLANRFVATAITTSALSLIAAYGMAQGKPAAPEKKPAAPAGNADAGPSWACAACECKYGGMSCPMHTLSALAEVKFEKTTLGASLHITARNPAELAEVQALAEKLAEHIKAGECAKGGDGRPHGHSHGHGPAR